MSRKINRKQDVSIVIKGRTRTEKIVFPIVFVLFLIYALSLVYPFVWLFLNSLKGSLEYSGGNAFALPENWKFSNYIKAFEMLNLENATFFDLILNSVWYTLVSSVLSVFMCSITGYCLSKYDFRAKKYIYAIAIFCMTIPIVGSLASNYKLIGELHLYDTPLYAVVTHLSSWGFNFLVMYGFFKNVSWSYAEAAFIDGGGHFMVFFRIMLPLALGPIVTLFVVAFVQNWNDYMTMILYMPSYPTLSSGLYEFQANAIKGVDYPVYFAGLLISLIPTLVIFGFCSDIMMSNMNVGGIKA